jgi:hypothetical protein
MKSFESKRLVALAVGCVALGVTTYAQAWDNDKCSNATLHGDYGFTITGQIFPPAPAPAVPVNGVALTTFNGDGTLTQTDYVVKSGSPAGPLDSFRMGETGSYTVNADCTGTATIMFPAPDFAPPQKLVLMFVIVNHGHGIRTVVAALYVGAGIESGTPTPANIASEATRL